MSTKEQITKQQWDMLDGGHKKVFQDELGKKFSDGNSPSYMDVLTFLGNNGLPSTELKQLSRSETLPVLTKELDDYWNDVVNFLNKK